MNNKTIIYVVRHAQSRANAGEYTDEKSVLESPLSDLGIKQANAISSKLISIHLDKIFSSDLPRAESTAKIIAAPRNMDIITSDKIRERSYHAYSLMFKGGEIEFIREIREKLRNLDDKGKMQFKLSPEMESAEEGALRLFNFIKEQVKKNIGKTILIVCHGNIMRSLLTYIGYAKFDELPAGAIENTGYFVLKYDGKNFNVIETNSIKFQKDSIRDF